MAQYLINVLVAFDRLVNALFRGHPSETLSSVAFRKHRDGAFWGWTEPFVNWLFTDESHCARAYVFDRNITLPK